VPKDAVETKDVVVETVAGKSPRQFDRLPDAKKEQYVDLLKERIYATITLIAILSGQLPHAATIKSLSLLLSIFGTVFALWGATIIAHRLSYRVVHGEDRTQQSYRKLAVSSFGLLIPAIVPSVVTLGSVVGLYDATSAIIVSIVLLLVTLFSFALMATSRVYKSLTRVIFIALVEMVLGCVIVAIKVLTE